MKKRTGRILLLCMLLCVLGLLTACGVETTVEDMFTLPRLPDEYTGLSQQIEQLISDGYEYVPPTAGENIQSVQMEDLTGDGIQEAVVFLRRAEDEKPLKILVFERTDESYDLLCTVESSGSSIDSVYYEDLTGDGRRELVVGWKISSTVQTVAVYNIGREAIQLMSAGYTRFVVQELNTYSPPGLFVLRSDSDGIPVAEIYTWQTNILAVSYRCGLSSTMADLARGSVVKGTLIGGRSAVFITGVNDAGSAVTDILTWQSPDDVVNLTLNQETGKSDAIQVYRQLLPQDVNDDGVTEIPAPEGYSSGNDTLTTWLQYNRSGWCRQAMRTFHCQSGGWYFELPMNWWGSVSFTSTETVAGENQITLYVDNSAVLSIYTITNENRESRAVMGERFVLWRQTGTVYAAELYDGAELYGCSVQWVGENFHMMVSTWQSANR